MNNIQKIILGLGVTVLTYIVIATPKVQYYKDVVFPADFRENLANQADWITISTYSLVVIVIIMGLFLITKSRNQNKS